MPSTLGELMTANPVALESSATVAEAAQAMRDNAIGDVLVTQNGSLFGILTDRDIVTRCIAEGGDPQSTPIGDICSTSVIAFSPSDEVEAAVEAMRDDAVRRVAIVDGDTPVGVVSLGDLAIELDRQSALGEISASAPNN